MRALFCAGGDRAVRVHFLGTLWIPPQPAPPPLVPLPLGPLLDPWLVHRSGAVCGLRSAACGLLLRPAWLHWTVKQLLHSITKRVGDQEGTKTQRPEMGGNTHQQLGGLMGIGTGLPGRGFVCPDRCACNNSPLCQFPSRSLSCQAHLPSSLPLPIHSLNPEPTD